MMKRPSPHKPLPSIMRDAQPSQVRPTRMLVLPEDEEAAREIISNAKLESAALADPLLVPQLLIIADITIPRTRGYARRLGRLVLELETRIREEAPWLSNLELKVRR